MMDTPVFLPSSTGIADTRLGMLFIKDSNLFRSSFDS